MMRFANSDLRRSLLATVAIGVLSTLGPAADAQEQAGDPAQVAGSADDATPAGADTPGGDGDAPAIPASATSDSAEEAEPTTQAERYATFEDMAGQIAAQLDRAAKRLGEDGVDGVVGQDSFVERHKSALAASRAVIDAGQTVPEGRLAAHERDVLSFLNQATQLSRLLSDLQQIDTATDAEAAEALRAEIREIASTQHFRPLKPDAPARLTLDIVDPQEGAVFWPRTIHQLQANIANAGDRPAQGVAAVLEPDNSVIATVSTAAGECSETDSGLWRCRRDRLDAGDDWTVSVAFHHAYPDEVPAGPTKDVRLEVRVGARLPAVEEQRAIASYPVAACSANFHGALGDIQDREADVLLAVLKRTQRGDRTLPRRWRSPATRWPGSDVADLIKRISRVVSSRGIDPWLTRQASGQAVSRVVYGLRQYVRQDYYDAMCTGTQGVIRFYRGFLEDFEARRQRAATDVKNITTLAAGAVRRYADLVAADASTGDGAGQVAALETPASPDATALVQHMAAVSGVTLASFATASPGEEGDAAKEPPDHPVLSAIDELLDADIHRGSSRTADFETDSLAQAARQAAVLVEATYFAEQSRDKYQAMARAFDDLMGSLASAHAANCICQTSGFRVSPTEASFPIDGVKGPDGVPRQLLRRVPAPRPKPTVVREASVDAGPAAEGGTQEAGSGVSQTTLLTPPARRDQVVRPSGDYRRVFDTRAGRYILVPAY